MRCRPIEVSRDGFRFCRYSVAILLWLGVLLRSELLVLVVAVIMAASAAF
ncbi:MAG: hypothetical protein HUU35_08780, partial [Armatimonadetes bacterium]|nr:hypothetical protein [Armatimonadota bacterium]